MRRHSSRNLIIYILYTGILAARAHTVDILGVGTLEAFVGISATADKFPDNQLSSNPLLTVGVAQVFAVAGLAVQKRDINCFSCRGRNTVPSRRLALGQGVARIKAVAGFDAVRVFTVSVDSAKFLTGRSHCYIAVGNGFCESDNTAAGIVTIIKGDGCGISGLCAYGKGKEHGEDSYCRKNQRGNSFEFFT